MQHDPTRPFNLCLPLHNVHAPFEAPDEQLNKYAVIQHVKNVVDIKLWSV